MKKIFLWLLIIPVFAFADELEVISLKHRSADEMLPIIRPLLDKGAVASGMNYQLILRTSPHNLAQIKKLLESLDIAPRRLKITVVQNVDSETVARFAGLSGRVGLSREAHITVPGSGNNSGLNVELGQGQDKLKAHVISTRSLEDEHKTQQLQVLEGNRAFVRSGQDVPLPQRQVIRYPWGTQVIDSTQHQEVSSGFYVLPHINGDRVTLEISVQNDTLRPNAERYPGEHSSRKESGAAVVPPIRSQQTSSIVSSRLGEWLALGESVQQRDDGGTAIAAHSTSQMHELRNILILVEEIR